MRFSDRVYNLCKKIPEGKVSTYKEVAEALNCKAYRAVGNALNRNKNKDVPCFKIIRSNGFVGGYALGIREKIKMLKKYGVKVTRGKINLRKYLYQFK